MQKVYIERFQWPLALGLLCLVLEPLIGIRRQQQSACTDSAACRRAHRALARFRGIG